MPIQLIIIKQKSYFIAAVVEDLCWNFIFFHVDFSSSVKEKYKVNLSPGLGLASCQIQLITTGRNLDVNRADRVILIKISLSFTNTLALKEFFRVFVS